MPRRLDWDAILTRSISVSDLGKRYELGLTHAGSIRELTNGMVRRVFGRNGTGNDKLPSMVDSSRVEDGHFWALSDVSFDVGHGEAIGIIGKNGAGKSTLLKILSQITRPTKGRAVLHGRVASLLEVGTGFHPELTGRENVYLNGTILGMRKREINRQLDSIVDFAGVEKFLDTPVKRYSSGMTVRLGFAVAAHLDPEILIVDEVLAVGDIEFQKRCLGKMQSAAESGKTVLFVSHNLASIRSLTNRTIVLSGGRLVFDGSTEEGISRYIRENLVRPDSKAAIVDLPRPFSGLDRKLEFVDLRIADLSVDGCLDSDAPFRLGVTIRATDHCDDFLLGLTVFTEDKLPVGSTFSAPITSPQSGSTDTFEFQALFPLAPGRYHCAISISNSRSAGKLLHDSLTDVLPFEISAPVMDARGWNPAWGIITLPLLERRSA